MCKRREENERKRTRCALDACDREKNGHGHERESKTEKKRSETTTKNHFCKVSRIIVALNVNCDYTLAMHALSSSTSTLSLSSWWWWRFAAKFRTQITYQILYFYLRVVSQSGRFFSTLSISLPRSISSVAHLLLMRFRHDKTHQKR